ATSGTAHAVEDDRRQGVTQRYVGWGEHGWPIATFVCTVLIAIIQALIFMPADLPATSAVWQSLPTGIALVLLIILPGNVAILWGAKFVSPTTTSIMMMAEVAVATISAALLLGTEMGTVEILGGLIIVFAGFLDVWGERTLEQQQVTTAEYVP
ncbi:MAG: EamA family transporter, partial [Chloroflexota bacterium]